MKFPYFYTDSTQNMPVKYMYVFWIKWVLLCRSISNLVHTALNHTSPHTYTAKYQVNILKKLRSINVDYHQVGWYQSTYLNSHINKEFLESHVRYQQSIEESIVLIYGEPSWCEY